MTSDMTSQKRFMLMAWQVQDAKARFSEFLDASLRNGPQIVTRRGVEAAVLVPIEEWRRLKHAARPTLKQLLLAAEGRFEIPVPERGGLRRRQSREPA
jgi:antitoxin Phd